MSHLDVLEGALAGGVWHDESDDETKSYESDYEDSEDEPDKDSNPLGPDYLPIIQDQLESNPGEEDYPRSALLHPFPEPCGLQVVKASQILPQHNYLYFSKTDHDVLGLYWFSRIEGGLYYLEDSEYPGEVTSLSRTTVNERLKEDYVFQVSGTVPFDAEVRTLEELVTDEHYILIPRIHPERKKLMVFKGCMADGSCKWTWSWKDKSANISIPKTLMPAILKTSLVYKLSKPLNPLDPEPFSLEEVDGVTFTQGPRPGEYGVIF